MATTSAVPLKPGPLHPLIVPILHNAGQLQYRSGKIEEAIVTYTEALAQARALYGHFHVAVGATLNSLGVLHYHLSSDLSSKAMELFQEALEIRRAALGLEHADVATTLNNMGRIHVQRDEFDAALGYYEDALRIRKACLGYDKTESRPSRCSLYPLQYWIVSSATGELRRGH
uniref:Kinesin light chain n=1 Tax=Attheya septentrionalis TaxID=420275 RepID=A0A7S2UBM0_9STRA|mmetsp:Transcript_1874/g.3351  ORF Transcript_1874/g.3351 Transcript_1874/m.3351 type:complete len:173 (+) Transcript_1874:45-563(+)